MDKLTYEELISSLIGPLKPTGFMHEDMNRVTNVFQALKLINALVDCIIEVEQFPEIYGVQKAPITTTARKGLRMLSQKLSPYQPTIAHSYTFNPTKEN